MIKILFKKSQDGKSFICEISGHAGQNETGMDIICSASSILAFTLAQNVVDSNKEGKLSKKPTIELKEGWAKIVAKPKKDYVAEILNEFISIKRGYELLAINYPQYVQFDKPQGFQNK